MVMQNSAIQLVPSLCSSSAPLGRGLSRSKQPMLSMPKKPPPNRSRPLASLRLTQKLKLSISFWNISLRKSTSPRPVCSHFDLIDAPRRPADHGRVDVVKVPLVGRILAVSMLIPFATHAQQLPLGKCRVDLGDRHAVKREIPGGIPGILPGVGHQDHVGVVQFLPARVASVPALFGGRGLRGIAHEPAVHVVVVVLF